jgi:crotonobetainyl-CoA:carnitine CoA-transferase CaiB-like acyl-CoA transferase
MPGPLEGVVVADFTQLMQGPYATQILGDMGADIIKIEPPRGDWSRGFSLLELYKNGESVSFMTFNRNKRSISIDLKTEEGREVVRRIVKNADVVVENFRPGVMDRLGIGYEALKEVNPRIIYCASCGYGQTGPYADRPGQDLLIQAMSGMTVLTGNREDNPSAFIAGIADLSTSQMIVYGICAALFSRERTGKGQRVDTNLYNAMLSMNIQEIANYLNGGGIPERSVSGYPNPYVGAPYGIYHTADQYIAIAMNPINKVARLLGVDKYQDVTGQNVFERRDEISADFAAALRTKTTQEWLDILLAEDIWCAPVYYFSDLEHDPQVAENEMIIGYQHPVAGEIRNVGIPVKFTGTPSGVRYPPPLLGQHSQEILQQIAGYSPAEAKALLEKKVVIGRDG